MKELYRIKNGIRSYSATAENKNANSGEGGKANFKRKGSPCIEPMKAHDTYVLLHKKNTTGIIRKIWCTIPVNHKIHLRNLIIRIYWDGATIPSVEVPIGDFFGIAHGRQKPMISEYVGMQDGRGFNCFIPMPFKQEVLITVENDSPEDVAMFFYQIDFTLGDMLEEDIGYFHAQFRRENPCPIKNDYIILDGIKGRGVYIGTILGIRNCYETHIEEWWGEGEVKYYIDDDEEYPTICTTGLEDYIGSGWGTEETCTPYQGAALLDNERGYYSLYRFHKFDPIYFDKALKITVQQLGSGNRKYAEEFFKDSGGYYKAAGCAPEDEICLFERSDDYCSVALWYQTLPTVLFPELPDRDARMKNL